MSLNFTFNFKSIIVAVLCFFSLNVFSQKLSDTIHLKGVDVYTSRKGNEPFLQVQLDSVVMANSIHANLSELMSRNTSVFIKSYGMGSLSTPSFRGTSANHTLVEWNGMKLNSAVNGQIDFAIIPATAFDKLDVKFGSASMSENTGAFGGLIQLSSDANWDNRMNVSLSQFYSSLNNWTSMAVVKIGNDSFQSVSRLSNTSNENLFSYNNILKQGNPIENSQHNSFHQQAFIQELYWRFKKQQQFSLKLWYSHNEREIPPIMNIQNLSNFSSQTDESFFVCTHWDLQSKKGFQLNNDLNYSYTFIHYKDSLSSLFVSHFINTLTEKFSFKQLRLLKWMYLSAGANYEYDKVASGNFSEYKYRHIATVFADLNMHAAEKLSFDIQARENYLDDQFSPLAVVLALHYKPFNSIEFYVKPNVSTNNRFPTMNDLYWVPGGNPNLKSERNYTAELNLYFETSPSKKLFHLTASGAAYISNIDDMIIWAPLNASYFESQNLKKVKSEGIDLLSTASVLWHKWKFLVSANYSYCKSVNEKSNLQNDNSVGKQMIYTPLHAANGAFTVEYSGFVCTYRQQYVGRRYISSDNLVYLPDYSVGSVQLSKKFNYKAFSLQLWFDVQNLFDEAYESVAYRPMPERFYEVGLRIGFNK
ncbi:MAG: TonB-dependent receptor plug domain-containing protein [Bacteroidota bacterium]